MGFNICAVLGAVIAVVACLLSSGLLISQEIAEVFVAKGGGELSCAIGNLGIRTAGFDASCLTDEELVGSGLGVVQDGVRTFNIEAFEANVEEFKLLFPTQEGFVFETNIAFVLLQVCIADCEADPGGPDCPGTLNDTCNAENAALLFPTFDDSVEDPCAAFWDSYKVSQPFLWTGQTRDNIDPLLMPALIGLPFQPALEAFYDDSIIPFLNNYVGAIGAVFGGAIGNDTLSDPLAGDAAVFSAVAASFEAPVDGILGAIAASVAGSCSVGQSINECIGGIFGEATLSSAAFQAGVLQITREDYAAAFCQIHTGVAATCALHQWGYAAGLVVTALAGASGVAGTANEALFLSLAQAFNLQATFVEVAKAGTVANGAIDVTNVDDLAAVDSAFVLQLDLEDTITAHIGGFLVGVGATDNLGTLLYPAGAAALTDGYPVCEILQGLGAISPSSGSPCSFALLFSNIGNIAAAVPDVPEDLLALANPLQGLFAACFFVMSLGNNAFQAEDCWDFFASQSVSLAFSNAYFDEISEDWAPTETFVFDLAKDDCKDDELDLIAITTAQNMVPVGIAFLAIGALVAIAGAGLNNKIIALISGIILIVGGVVVLSALLTVYDAPIYQAVGDPEDSVANEVIYVSGKTINIGVFSIILGIASGVCMVVAAIMMHRSPDDQEVKALGGGEQSTVSI